MSKLLAIEHPIYSPLLLPHGGPAAPPPPTPLHHHHHRHIHQVAVKVLDGADVMRREA